MKSWLEPEVMDVPDALRDAVGGHPVVAARLARRGLLTPAAARRFLDPGAYSPADPGDLPDMDAAVSRVQKAINGGEDPGDALRYAQDEIRAYLDGVDSK